MQQQLPKNLLYNDIKPIGFPSHVRQEKYTPIAFNTSTNGVSNADVVRFNISTNGFWDPYSAYIKIEVDVSQMDGNKDLKTSTFNQSSGCLQVDNSAQSFINQLVIYKGGVEIERIEEYDTLAAILNDMNCSGDDRLSRYFEGMYMQTTPAGQQYSNPSYAGASINSSALNQFSFSPNQIQATNNLSTPSIFNSVILSSSSANIGRYEFWLCGSDGKNGISSTAIGDTFVVNGSQYLQTQNNIQYGYNVPFNQSLSSFGNEQILSNNFYQNTFIQGKSQAFVCNKQTFCFPLISGLLGILMPHESYKYIPMKALQELIIEFRLSPFAMFTSGYADGLSNSTPYTTGTTALNTNTFPMLSRTWKITRFEINVEVQYFEPQIENIILSQLNTEKGIVLHTNSWQLGPRYQIAANTTPVGTYQVNLGFESLKNVIWVYLPDEYTTYTFTRKQYRLSANLTSMYIKVGSEYYPPLPITGHGGTCGGYLNTNTIIGSDASNSEFLVQLYKVFGKFNDIQQNCIINPVNFAVNYKVYNPTNVLPLYTVNVQTNFDTAQGQAMFHENRCVGRAIYGLNLETLNQDFTVISGINTINNRPFEITVKSDQTNSYPRSYTMYVFCQYDMLVQLRTSGVQILGRG